MFYHQQGYYVPVAIYVRNDHPQTPPVCLIKPTPDMMIKQNHQHVDVKGVVYLPYLHRWDKKSTINGTIQAISEVFGRDPFIFKKPANPRPSPTSTPPYASGDAKGGSVSKPSYTAVPGQSPKDSSTPKPTLPASRIPPPPPIQTMMTLNLSGEELSKEVQNKAREMDELDGVLENSFRCPISMEIMSDPVFAADGHTYERVEIERWLQNKNTSPLTNEVLPHKHLVPNYNLRSQIKEYDNRFSGGA